MQKEQRKTDFWIRNKSQKSKAAPGKYKVPMLSARKDHYYGPSGFGSTQDRFEKKIVKPKPLPPGPGDYEVDPLSLVSRGLKHTYKSVFNSKVEGDRGVCHSHSNSSLHRHVARTAHTSQLNNSILKDGVNLHKNSKRRKNSENFGSPKHDKLSNTYQFDSSSKAETQGELGSLILNSPLDHPKKKATKVVKGVVCQIKTQPSIPMKKVVTDTDLSPAKYDPKHELLHRKAPIPMIKPHKISSPKNNGSLNKYIQGFIQDVVHSTSSPEHGVKQILVTLKKSKDTDGKNSSLNNTSCHNSVIHTMSQHMNYAKHAKEKIDMQQNDDSFYIEANEHNSIAMNTAPIESNIKMRSPFVSKTERYPEIKQSPGPGSYNVTHETEKSVTSDLYTSPQAFGSTYRHRTHFLNVENTPFGEPSYMKTPGVGHYYKEKKIPKRIQKEILTAQKEREMEEGYANRPGFLGGSERP